MRLPLVGRRGQATSSVWLGRFGVVTTTATFRDAHFPRWTDGKLGPRPGRGFERKSGCSTVASSTRASS